VFHFILTIRVVVFHALGYALLLWVHRDDPVTLLAYALVLGSYLLEQTKYQTPQNGEVGKDGSNDVV
jgi:membrane protein required for beta-lactamase induction